MKFACLPVAIVLLASSLVPVGAAAAVVAPATATLTMGSDSNWNWNVTLNPVDGNPEVVAGNFNVVVVDRPVAGGGSTRMIIRQAEVQLGDVAVYGASGSVMLDADPFVVYSFGVSNFSSLSTTFGFAFTSPYVAGPYDTLSSTHQSGVTDGGGGIPNGSVSVTPGTSGYVHNPFLDGPDVGLPAAMSTGCSVGGGSSSCFTSATTLASVVAGPGGVFGTSVNFTLSGSDSFSTTGRVELLATPEPVSFGLLAAGMLFLAGVTVRRR